MLDDDYSVGDSSDFDKQKSETHRSTIESNAFNIERERVVKDNSNPLKRHPSRDSHYSLRRSREVAIAPEIIYNTVGLCPFRGIPEYLDPSVFWKEVDRYYKRFEPEQITWFLGQTDEDPCFNSQESSIMPINSVLSCLIPENDFASSVECPSKRLVMADHHTMISEREEQELAHLTPYLMDELTMLGLVDGDAIEGERGSLYEEITKLVCFYSYE